MIRVLLVDPSPRGGIPAYTLLLARSLRAVGACPEILGSKALEASATELPVTRRLPVGEWGKPASAGPGFYVHRLKTWLVSAAIVLRHVSRSRPDVVHFQNPINRRFDAWLIRRLERRTRVVWTAHDVLPFERKPRDTAWFQSIYRAVSRVVVHSEPAAAEVERLAGVDPVVIPHPVRDDVIEVSRDEARRQLGLPSGGRLLCSLGFIRPYKGYGLLAEVWEHLGSDAPMLLVMGELLAETERPVLDRLAGTGRVDVRLGYASERDLQLALKASDALLTPYESASDSGLVHLARALRVPVIASDVPQLEATVRSSGAGVSVPRTTEAWSAAVVGQLPPEPGPAPDLAATGELHLNLYQELLGSRKEDRPLRLAVYCDATEIAGAENALGGLLTALKSSIEIVVVGVHPEVVGWLAAKRPGTEHVVLPAVRNKWDLRPIAAHVRTIRKLRPDVVHASLRHPWSCQYAILAGLLTPGAAVIATEHLPLPASASFQRNAKRLLSKRLAAHVAVGVQAARILEGLTGEEEGSVRTIYNGIDPTAPTGREQLAKPPVVGFMGRLADQKGVDVLLRALTELPDASCVVVGDGPLRAEVDRLIDDLGLNGRVIMAGWRQDFQNLLATFDVLAVPSLFEGLPLVVLEAMFAGVPVVASDVGSLSEALEDGVSGLLVPPGDVDALRAALARLLADDDLRRRIGERGREVASSRFSLQAMATAYESLYAEVTG